MGWASRRGTIVLLVLAAVVGGCAAPEDPALTIEARVTLCPADADCLSLPAAGATYAVARGGEELASGHLGDDGSVTVELGEGAGDLTARVTVPELEREAVETVTTPPSGGVVSLTLELPAVRVDRAEIP